MKKRLSFLVIFFGCLAAAQNVTVSKNLTGFYWDESGFEKPLARAAQARGLRFFWWNITNGRVNKVLNHPSLDQNIRALLATDLKPDFIALAEFNEQSLSAETLGRLAQAYSQKLFIPYNQSTPGEGMAIYSRIPFTLADARILDWTPPALRSDSDREVYRKSWQHDSDSFTRPLIVLKFAARDTGLSSDLYVNPVHLLDPWRDIRKRIGAVRTAEVVQWSMKTPLGYQMTRMMDGLARDFGTTFEEKPLLSFGDFNTPKGYVSESAGYRYLTSRLTDRISGHPTTFPARSAPERKSFPLMEIDHAFSNGLVGGLEAEVLPLQGSDHYPLYIVLTGLSSTLPLRLGSLVPNVRQ